MPVLGQLLAASKCDPIDCTLLLIDGFHELPNHQRHALNPLDLFLCSHKLALQIPRGGNSVTDNCCVLRDNTDLCSSLMYSSCSWMYLVTHCQPSLPTQRLCQALLELPL
jgi:hypothetical protein